MPIPSFGRRRMLGLSALGLSSLVAGCAAGSTRRTSTAPAGRGPAFDQRDADVWSDTARVTGRDAVGLTVNGRPQAMGSVGDRFTADVVLRPGPNLLVARSPAGYAELTLTGRLSPQPIALPVAVIAGPTVHLRSASRPNVMTRAPLRGAVWRRNGTPFAVTADTTAGLPHTGVERFELTVGDTDGETSSAVVSIDCTGSPRVLPAADAGAAWVSNAVVYGVVPPLFGRQPYRAVAAALPRLAALGVTVLWLAPVFACVPDDYGYEVTDLFALRSDWGDETQLRELVTRAHDHGLKVILDLPLNDTSRRHPYFQDSQRYGERSHYYDFYVRSADGTPQHYFDWTWLPNLDYDSAEVRAMATAAALHWLERLDHDGYRVDAAWGVARRRPGFWAGWTDAVRRLKPDVMLIAEGSARRSGWGDEGFDLAYDWTGHVGQWAWHDAFTTGDIAAALRRALQHRPRTPPLRYLDDNDTGARFASRHGPGMTRAAVAALMTLDGVPQIFTGSEIGARFSPYRRTRPLNWTSDAFGLQQHYRRLIRLRQTTPQLRGAGVQVLPPLSVDDPVLRVRRWGTDPRHGVDVAINFSDAPVLTRTHAAEIHLPPWGYDIG